MFRCDPYFFRSIYSNRRHIKSGHLFQGRYKSFLVEGGNYLLGLSRYMHLNPVRGRVIGAGDPQERRKGLRAYPGAATEVTPP